MCIMRMGNGGTTHFLASGTKKGDEQMSNGEIYAKLQAIDVRMADYEKRRMWKERQALTAKYQVLYRKYQFGFHAGDQVEVREGQRWVPARILEHTKANYFMVAKGEYSTLKVPGFSIRVPQNHLQSAAESEQPSLF